MRAVYFKVLCIWLFLDDSMPNDITLVLLLEFHSVPFIVSLCTPAVTVGADFLCDKAAVLGDRIKGTSCSVLQERTASPAPLRSCLLCKLLCAVCQQHSATGPAVTRLLNLFRTFVFCTADGTVHCDHGRRLHVFESRMMNQLAVFVR